MMFERFTPDARHIVVQAQGDARRLGHNYIGCEHLLLAAASTSEPASAVLRDHGVTPERIEAEIRRIIAPGPAADPVSGIDREALAAIGIDLDVVRERIESVFGPGALARAAAVGRAAQAGRAGRQVKAVARPAQMPRFGPGQIPVGPPAPGNVPLFPGPAPRGHIPFTPRARKSLARSLREAQGLHDNYIGAQHLTLGLLAAGDGMVPVILSGLGVTAASLRAAILDRYRKAG